MKALKAQGISRDTLPWKAPCQPYAAYIAFAITAIVTIFKGFDSFMPKFNYKTFVTNYVAIPFWLALFLCVFLPTRAARSSPRPPRTNPH